MNKTECKAGTTANNVVSGDWRVCTFDRENSRPVLFIVSCCFFRQEPLLHFSISPLNTFTPKSAQNENSRQVPNFIL